MPNWLDELKTNQERLQTQAEQQEQQKQAAKLALLKRWREQKLPAHQAIQHCVEQSEIESLLLDLTRQVAAPHYSEAALLRELEYYEYPDQTATRRGILWSKQVGENSHHLARPISTAFEVRQDRCLTSIRWILVLSKQPVNQYQVVQVLVDGSGMSYWHTRDQISRIEPPNALGAQQALSKAYLNPSVWSLPHQADWYGVFSVSAPSTERRKHRRHRPWYRKLPQQLGVDLGTAIAVVGFLAFIVLAVLFFATRSP